MISNLLEHCIYILMLVWQFYTRLLVLNSMFCSLQLQIGPGVYLMYWLIWKKRKQKKQFYLPPAVQDLIQSQAIGWVSRMWWGSPILLLNRNVRQYYNIYSYKIIVIVIPLLCLIPLQITIFSDDNIFFTYWLSVIIAASDNNNIRFVNCNGREC